MAEEIQSDEGLNATVAWLGVDNRRVGNAAECGLCETSNSFIRDIADIMLYDEFIADQAASYMNGQPPNATTATTELSGRRLQTITSYVVELVVFVIVMQFSTLRLLRARPTSSPTTTGPTGSPTAAPTSLPIVAPTSSPTTSGSTSPQRGNLDVRNGSHEPPWQWHRRINRIRSVLVTPAALLLVLGTVVRAAELSQLCPAGCFCAQTVVICEGASLDQLPASSLGESIISADFQNNDVMALRTSDLVGGPSLEVLILAFNPLREIEAGAFNSTRNLQVLNLASTPLAELPRGILSPLELLTDFDASRTSLGATWLHSEPFRDNLQLTSINIRRSLAQAVDRGTFGHLTQLRVLDLRDNNIGRMSPSNLEGMLSTETETDSPRELLMEGNPSECTITPSIEASCSCGDNYSDIIVINADGSERSIGCDDGSLCGTPPDGAPFSGSCAGQRLCPAICVNQWFSVFETFSEMLCVNGEWSDPNELVGDRTMRCLNPEPFLEEDPSLIAHYAGAHKEPPTCRGNRHASMLYSDERRNHSVTISETGRLESVEPDHLLQSIFVWRFVVDTPLLSYWTRGSSVELEPGSRATIFQHVLQPGQNTPLEAGDMLCGSIGNVTVESVDTLVEDWWDGCADPNWLDLDDAVTAVEAGNPRGEDMITVVALGGGATVHSGSVEVRTLQPWETQQFAITGTQRAFSIRSADPMLVGTSCTLVEPTSDCRQQTGYVNMPPRSAQTEGYAHVQYDVNSTSPATALSVWRFIQPTHLAPADGGIGIIQPSHWVRSSPREAAELGAIDGATVFSTGPFWGGDGVAMGDLLCPETGGAGASAVANDIVQSSGTTPVESPDRCVDRNWHRVALAAQSMQRFVPENATKVGRPARLPPPSWVSVVDASDQYGFARPASLAVHLYWQCQSDRSHGVDLISVLI